MTYAYPEIKQFRGLYLQANSLGVPDGAMEEAMDIVLTSDNTIQKAPGFYQYYSGATPNALATYRSHLFAAFADRLSYFTDTGSSPNETGTKTDLTGATFAITAPSIVRFLEQSGNLYSSTDNGVLKIDDYNAKIFKAGAPPALDMRGTVDRANGVFAGNSEVAYRVLFGRRDANANLIIGSPSDILVLTNATVSAVSFTNPTANQVEVTVPGGHVLTTGMTINITAATGDTALANTIQTVIATALTATVFRFDKGSAVTAPGTITYTVTRAPMLEFSVPSDITTTTDSYFYRVYRSSQSSSDVATPSIDFRQIDEQQLTSGQISAGVVFYSDVIDDVLLTNAPYLYTNPNTGDGELQSNSRPPKCVDMTLFLGYVFYARATTRHTIEVDVVDSTVMSSGDTVKVTVDATTRTYVGRTGVGNSCVSSEAATAVGTTVTVTYTAHGLVAGDTIYVSNAKASANLPSGPYTIATAVANSFTFTASSAPTALTNLDFQGVTNGATGNPMFQLDSSSSSAATRLRRTARGIVKAINRDSSSLIYANYISSIVDNPGKMRFTSKGFGGAIYPFAPANGSAFSPPLPTTASTVFSTNETQKNAVYASKYQEPEAAPAGNVLFVGGKDKEILRVIALRNSVLVLKEDGVYKITGDSPRNFTATLLDNTTICIAANSATLLDNTVYFLATKGACAASETGARVVSRNIKRVIQPTSTKSAIATSTAGAGQDSGDLWYLSTIGPNDTSTTVCWIYNYINDTWTETATLFKSSVVGPSDKLYLVSTDGKIMKQRKNQDKTDFCGQNYSTTIVSVATDKLSAVFSISGYTPGKGDIFVSSGVITRIDTAVTSGANFLATFSAQTNLTAGAATLYAAISSKVTFAPFHGGSIGRMKQFGQMQIHTRDNGIYRLTIYFQNTYFGGSEPAEWLRSGLYGSGGWGDSPWGIFGWGLDEGIQNPVDTRPAPPIRVYIPQFAQRATYIKPTIEHNEAGDQINIQALTFAVRSYGERVNK